VPDATHETWRPVAGYEGLYEVSDLGRVRSLRRPTASGMRGGKILKPIVYSKYGHVRVGLHVNGRNTLRQVHQLVAEAFIGECPDGMEPRHGDGNAANNAAVNLSYGTKSDNCLDSVRHGTHRNARKTHCDSGHEFTPQNTWYLQGGRRCRTCQRDRQRAYTANRKLGASA
jgi:NUMOD4 motif/HNH endonuclease